VNTTFYARTTEVLPDEAPHGCIDGVVYIGHIVEDELDGEPQEVIERMPCRRYHVPERLIRAALFLSHETVDAHLGGLRLGYFSSVSTCSA
jgi:hypothetical protein